jgi:hypothetical protein
LTINYLKQFEPGDPIDVEVLNRIIQNVNYLAGQIAQIYKLPAPQAPTVTNTGSSGSTSGSTGGSTDVLSTGDSITPAKNQDIGLSFIARFNEQTRQTKVLETTQVEAALGGVKISSFEIIGVQVKSLMFIPAGLTASELKVATGAQLTGVGVNKNTIYFTPKPIASIYKSGVNAPSSTATGPYGRLYVNLGLTLKITY